MVRRAKGIQIYLKPGIESDDVLLDLWDACRKRDRPQIVFRALLNEGLKALLARDGLPPGVVRDLGLQDRAHVPPASLHPAVRTASSDNNRPADTQPADRPAAGEQESAVIDEGSREPHNARERVDKSAAAEDEGAQDTGSNSISTRRPPGGIGRIM